MSDSSLTIAAASLEVGVPMGLVVAYGFLPTWRKRLISIIGGITPITVTYLAFFFVLPLLPQNSEQDNSWAFHAVWVMSFGAFALSLLIGLCLAFLRKPQALAPRYFLGVFVPFAIAIFLFLHKHGYLPF